MSTLGHEKIQEDLNKWEKEAQIAKDNHFDCARRFGRIASILSWLAIVLTALVGASIFADLQRYGDAARIATGLVSFVASGVMALHTNLKYSERAQKHHNAGAGFSALADDIAFELARVKAAMPLDEGRIERILDQKDKVTKDAPEIPDDIYYHGSGGAPRCPVCHSEMKLRIAQKGPNAGQKFWGCSRYPDCKGTLKYKRRFLSFLK